MISLLQGIIIGVCVIIGVGSRFYGPFKGSADNIVEQAAEEIIKEETGFNIDLSPDKK